MTCCEPEVTGLISVCGIRKSELYGSLLYATVISSHKLRPRMTSLLQQQPVRLVSSAAQSKQQQQHPRRTLVQTLSPLIGSESLYLQCERSLKDELTSSLFFLINLFIHICKLKKKKLLQPYHFSHGAHF